MRGKRKVYTSENAGMGEKTRTCTTGLLCGRVLAKVLFVLFLGNRARRRHDRKC
jgi:hypothetical protein